MDKNNLMRKGLVIGIIVLFVGASAIPLIGGTNVEEKHNSIDGSVSFMGFNSRDDILYVGGSGEGNYSHIQDAIDNASDGDTVFVYDDSSPYNEVIQIIKSIHLIGENKTSTIINGAIYIESVNMVKINGFTIQNSSVNAVHLWSCDFNNISGNILKNSSYGIALVTGSDHNEIYENLIYNVKWGVALTESGAGGNNRYNSIIANNINCNNKTNSYGIYVEGSSWYTTINNNSISNTDFCGIQIGSSCNSCKENIIHNQNICSYGILVYSGDNELKNNSLINCGLITSNINDIDFSNTINGKPLYYLVNEQNRTIPLDAGEVILINCESCNIKNLTLTNSSIGILLHNTNKSMIAGNTITNQTGQGIRIYYSNNNTISDNIVKKVGWPNKPNTMGIWIWNSKNNTIFQNDLIENYKQGIYSSGSNSNIIYHNNFVNNFINAKSEVSTDVWDDGYPSGGNYWDDYIGDDNDNDGIGDTKYTFTGGQDNYPLMNLWGENRPVSNFTYSIDIATVIFNASSSYDRDGAIVDYAWGFGDDEYGYGMVVEHTYADNGEYLVTLIVTDNDDYEGNITKSIVIDGLNNPPYPPSDPDPDDSETDVDVEANLSWNCSDPDADPLTYDVYFGDTSPPPQVAWNQTETTYNPGTLDYETTYHWQIVAWDNHEASTSGPLWEFTTEGEPEPDLACEGELIWEDVVPGEVVEGEFEVWNCGDDFSELDWEITEWPDDWGDDWSFDPASGEDLTPEAGHVTVTVEVKAPDEENTEFEGEITIVNSNDPADTCTIPVYLKTPCESPFLQLLELIMQRFPILGRILSGMI